mgnify:CR=1 FL=1|jgi:hypothetical protein
MNNFLSAFKIKNRPTQVKNFLNLILLSLLIGCAPIQFDIGERLNTNLWSSQLEYEGTLSNGLTVYRVRPKFREDFATDGYLVDSKDVVIKSLDSDEINNYKELVLQEFKRENNRKEELRKAEENRRIDRIRQEEERIATEKAITKKSNELISSYNLIVLYQSKDFFITKNKAGVFIYIKNGAIRSKNEVMQDLSEYESKKAALIQEEKLRIANLAKSWQVRAIGHGHCKVTDIQQGARQFDGSQHFNIAYSCWRGSSGSSGVGVLSCGANQANYVNSNLYSAKCF